MPTAVGPNTKGEENLVFGYDLGDVTNSYKGEPTTNIVPSPANNGRFTTLNSWRTYNTNQYNSNTYFSIGTVSSISNNIVTLSSVGRTIRSFDVLTPQTTGGGVTAGTNYVVKKLSSTTFSLHEYNSSQNGSQGYINPDTGFYKVHDAYANDTRISINATDFPTMWWGPPHLPNSGLIKEIVEGGGRVRGTNAIRLHVYRGDGVADGMAYGVYCPVTQGDVITVTYWLRAATPNAANKGGSYTTYFGSGNASFSQGFACGEYNKWVRIKHQWTASATFNFYQYWFPQGSGDKYSIDIADLQVEVNKGHATPFVAGTRSVTQGLIDLTGNSTIDLTNVSFDSGAQMTFDGTDDYINLAVPTGPMYCLESILYNDNTIPGNDTAIGGPTTYQSLYRFNENYPMGVHFGAWTSGLTNEAIHIWSSGGAPYNATNTRTSVPSGWHHVIFNWNGSHYDIYVDGEKQTVYSHTDGHAKLINLTHLTVGNSVSPNYAFNGDVAVTKIYNRALTASEIKSNFNAIKGRFNI